MDNNSGHQSPLRIILIFSICACSLVMHLFTENPSLAGQTIVADTLEHGDHENFTHASGEDGFVIPCSHDLANHNTLIQVVLLDADILPSVIYSPEFPPPKPI